MDSTFKDKRISDIKNIWQSLLWHMRERNLRTLQISDATGYRIEHIERGLTGEPIPVTEEFLRRLVIYLGLVPVRTGRYEDRYVPTYDQCVELLKPPEEPPQQSSLWDK
jgi:hypothetical protein